MRDTRRVVILGFFSLIGAVFLIKLFSIQVLSSTYRIEADRNAVRRIITYPHRGLIYDRNDKLLIYNKAMFSINFIPSEFKLKDTLAFCDLVGISKDELIEKLKKAALSPNKPFTLLKQLSQNEFAKIQDRLMEYKGIYPEFRTIRAYPHKSMAHTLGYIGEISKKTLKSDTTGQYRQGDFIGISGIEAAYERELRGRLGVKYLMVDVNGNLKGAYKGGGYDTLAVAGKDLYSTIDLDLQQYGEMLMQGKRGSIVAIEPSTGEILAMVSSPSYDPNLLVVGSDFTKNYTNLSAAPGYPLFDRSIMALYPPGSVFKVVQLLVGMQEGVLVPNTFLPCDQEMVKCHGHPSPANLHQSIVYSCNPYYFRAYRRILYQNKVLKNDSIYKELPDGNPFEGFDRWRKYMLKFGLGDRLGIDMVNDKRGFVPDLSIYDEKYGRGNWEFKNLFSLGIGQAEMSILPVQMANLAVIIANRGFYYTPHVIKAIGSENGPKRKEFKVKKTVDIDQKYYDFLINGLRDVVLYGTATSANVQGLTICGKTGTAQNPHGEDHSTFIAFAPMQNPKIAIAVYVENAGFGGAVAAPIASLLIQKYLKTNDLYGGRQGLEQQVMTKYLYYYR